MKEKLYLIITLDDDDKFLSADIEKHTSFEAAKDAAWKNRRALEKFRVFVLNDFQDYRKFHAIS